MQINYDLPVIRFFCTWLGHEAVSLIQMLDQTTELVNAGEDLITNALCISGKKLSALKKLSAASLIDMEKPVAGDKWTIAVRKNEFEIPEWDKFFRSTALMFDREYISVSDVKSIDWTKLFAMIAQYRSPLRIGVGELHTIEIIVPSKGAGISKPFFILNNSLQVLTNGLAQILRSEHFNSVCSYQIVPRNDVIGIESICSEPLQSEHMVEMKINNRKSYRDVKLEEWTSDQFADYIRDRYLEVYERPAPFSTVEMKMAKIKQDGILMLARLTRQSETGVMAIEFKGYLDWLLTHKKFTMNLGNITSPRTMEIYLVEKLRDSKKQAPSSTIGIMPLNPYNLDRNAG